MRPLPLHHLRDLGLDVETDNDALPLEDAHVDAIVRIAVEGPSATFAVVARGRAPYVGELENMARVRDAVTRIGIPLLVAPHVSAPLARALREQGWSYLDESGNVELKGPGILVTSRRPGREHRSRRGRSALPHGSGSLRMARFMIEQAFPVTPTHLAKVSGTSPARASQVLTRLESSGVAERRSDGWWVDRASLLDLFLRDYRGPGGLEQRLHTLLSPLQVAGRMTAMLGDAWALSADLGPDLIVAWRAPSHLIAYAREFPHPARLDAVEVAPDEEANLLLVLPQDESVFSFPRLSTKSDEQSLPLADPVQMVWDLERLGGEDRAEAAERMRTWILEHH